MGVSESGDSLPATDFRWLTGLREAANWNGGTGLTTNNYSFNAH